MSTTPAITVDLNPSGGCDCINMMDTALEKGGYNTHLGTTLFFDGRPMRIEIATYKTDPKNRRRAVKVTPSHCPLCGVKYPDAPKAESEAAI